MAQRDIYHEQVKQALIKDGWTITHDPLVLSIGTHNLLIDLGAEQLLAAQKGQTQIAVEIKSFVSRSQVSDLEDALGQYILYRGVLKRKEPDRIIYLAVPQRAYKTIFNSPLGQMAIEDSKIKLLVFHPKEEVIKQWIE